MNWEKYLEEKTKKDVFDWIKASLAVTTIRNEVFGCYGGHSMGMETGYFHLTPTIKTLGTTVRQIDQLWLMEAMKNIDEKIEIIPAHAWTPWYSIFGSMSGFDSVEECFKDQSKHIFALETGLSSDPLMNWRLSKLDKYTLVSNSDAHSPQKLELQQGSRSRQ